MTPATLAGWDPSATEVAQGGVAGMFCKLLFAVLGLLLAHLPLAPLALLAAFVDSPVSTLHRHVNQLVDAGLIATVTNPLPGHGRPGRLLYLSRLGLATTSSDGVEPGASARKLAQPTRNATVPRFPKHLPGWLAAYELLGLLAARGHGSPTLCRWECPWRQVVLPRTGARNAPRVVRLPAAAALVWTTAK